MKNILIINKYFWPKIGGIEKVAEQHAKALSKSGFDVDILCCHESKNKSQEINLDGLKIYKRATLFELFSMPISLSFITFFLGTFINMIIYIFMNHSLLLLFLLFW